MSLFLTVKREKPAFFAFLREPLSYTAPYLGNAIHMPALTRRRPGCDLFRR